MNARPKSPNTQLRQTSGENVDPRDLHMAQRKASGISHREVAREFGVPKSTVHRRIAAVLKQGYRKLGDG